MAVNQQLFDRVSEALLDLLVVEEKKMFGGICFLVDDKLCICVKNDEILCRIDPKDFEEVLEREGVRPMRQSNRTAKGYVYVHADVIKTQQAFDYWINRALTYNKIAKASKKKK